MLQKNNAWSKAMVTKNWFGIAAAMLFWQGCASVQDAGKAYFSQGTKVKGVEAADALIERMNKERELRVIMYGQTKAAKIISCTILRNQFYVASMKSSANQEVQNAAKLFEEGYQQNDEAFLTACDQVLSTELGRTFLTIQQQYLAREK